MSPLLITFNEAGEETVPVGLMLLSTHEKSPGLLVVRRRRPTGRFKEATQFVRLYRSFGKCTRAPASLKEIMKRMLSLSRFFHQSVFDLSVSLLQFLLGLQPVFHLISLGSTTLKVDFISSPFNVFTRRLWGRLGSFFRRGPATCLGRWFLRFALRHGCLLDEGHELTVGGSLHRL